MGRQSILSLLDVIVILLQMAAHLLLVKQALSMGQQGTDPLQSLNHLLQPVGLAHLVDAAVLHPGLRRQQLVRAVLTR